MFIALKKQMQADLAFDNMRLPINERSAVRILKTPKLLKFIGKYGGCEFSAWGAYDINEKYRTHQISTTDMFIEQGSNGVGAIPLYGTAWTIGWETGRAITETSSYQNFKKNAISYLGGYYYIPIDYRRSKLHDILKEN